ncbi:MAG: hypothetical protein OEX13_20995 [Gammaproteobacteria bacterium]|nr:hypothetical protein [Gammaproteobacteria bacterium]
MNGSGFPGTFPFYFGSFLPVASLYPLSLATMELERDTTGAELRCDVLVVGGGTTGRREAALDAR